jgi:hypothetical protein
MVLANLVFTFPMAGFLMKMRSAFCMFRFEYGL